MSIASNVRSILNLLRGFSPAAILNELEAIDLKLNLVLGQLSGPETGYFIPPHEENFMSVLELEVGQTATGVLTFSESTPPPDGAVASDNPGVCPISLAADLVTWTAGPALSVGAANMTYTGTSAPPDVGPAQIAPMAVTVVAVPVAETGDFNPGGATITGP